MTRLETYRLNRLILLPCAVAAMLLAGCGEKTTSLNDASTAETATAPAAPKIDRVFFAQQHVHEPTHEYFKLVGNLEALIKVQVYADRPTPAPDVFALLTLGDKQRMIRLRGPAILPQPYTGDPVLFEHTYDDSFTAMIPREWIQPGLEVAVELRRYDYTEAQAYDRYTADSTAIDSIDILDRKALGPIKVGAPSPLPINVFDVHYFGRSMDAALPSDWDNEFKQRVPISDMTLHHVKKIALKPVVWAPHAGNPSMTLHSPEEYERRTGKPLDGEQRMSLQLLGALKRAAGHMGPWRLYYLNIAGLHAGGQAAGYRSVGSIHRNGVLIHEIGHSFGLPHWTPRTRYPYQSTMYGETPGEKTRANAGPTWAFDLHRRAFLKPYESKSEDGYVWTRDPMMGGGKFHGPTYIYRHFSDYSVHRIQHFLENRVVYWNDELGEYAKWNPQTNAYDQIIENDGLLLPIERDAQVYSILATASLVVDDGSIIYPPIGPYTAGLIKRFDADTPDGRAAAKAHGWDEKGYNVCLRVTQGGKVRTWIVDLKLSEDDDPLKSFHVGAINLPARDGEITRVELIHAPDVVNQGISADARVLFEWTKP